MKFKKIKHVFFAVLLLMPVFTNASNNYSLSELQAKVTKNSAEIKIAYENYYQSRKQISLARATLLPHLDLMLIGVAQDLSSSWLYLVPCVLPMPSDMFKYKGSKYLALAEKHTSKSVQLNIYSDLTNDYYDIKLQEELLISLQEEKEIYGSLLKQYEAKETLGFGMKAEIFKIKRQILLINQQIDVVKSIIISEKLVINIALDQDPKMEMELDDVDIESPSTVLIPETVDEAIELAIKNSHELKANNYYDLNAKYNVKSAKWSIISFTGIGFGYSARIGLEHSKRRVIKLLKIKMKNEISGQIGTSITELMYLNERIKNATDLFHAGLEDTDILQTLFESDNVALDELLKAKIAQVRYQRSLVTLKYERLKKINKINRLLGYKTSEHDYPFNVETLILDSKIEKSSKSKKMYYTFALSAGNLEMVESVLYDFERFTRLETDYTNNFKLKFNSKRKYRKVTVVLTLKNGITVTKRFEIRI